ncbi:DUF4255 domain-containing protein [Massilia sp. TS11]|uniref:DUF4255 domain-containing protein n=1 Tax=Massilia sp. TS11 TaxID=2908003 RepID=UPI001EDB9678|nr:DUF4255 domain-containing protein [Massilia sp. TS11]MCG2584151.1 DUF4255 domain-containing protein [Massilia sp. TS11]
MIDTALGFVLTELNTYLSASFGGGEKHAVLGSVASPAAGGLDPNENRVVLSLVNLERETAIGSTGFVAGAAGAYTKTNPTLYLNLYVLVAANYPNNYDNALKMLSACMGFFQARQLFDPQNSARFPADMAQLTMEIVSLSLAELSTLWAVLGNNYLPSAVYKLRMITVQNAWTINAIPTVQTPAASLEN